MDHVGFDSEHLSMELIHRGHAVQAIDVLSDKLLYTYIPRNPPILEDLERQYRFWERRDSPDETEYWLNWVIFLRTTRECVGTVQIGIDKQKREGSIAYMIGRNFQGRGYGTESVRAMLEHCQSHYGVQCFKAWIDTRNGASIRLVQKLGMKQVEFIEKADHFDGEDSDEYVFQLDVGG